MKRILLSVLFCLPFFLVGAQECIPAKPNPARFVNNFSKEYPDFLSNTENQALEEKLQNFNKETSNQIVIVIVDDLCGFDANEFSTRLGKSWGVGQGKFDNGVVIMIKPTGGAGQRDAYIAVGYGLEGVIPDVIANRILDNEVIPYFKNGDFYAALDGSTGILMSLANKEYSYQDYQGKASKDWSPLIVFVIIITITIIFASRRSRSYTMSRNGRRFYGGGWGGGFGGFGGGRGFGGGGGSFGGGSFGGGGAGGKW